MILSCAGLELPAPDSISIDDEIIWSSDTGRTLDGTMIGDVIAEKKSMKITWGILTDTQMAQIKEHLIAGFFPITFHDTGSDVTIESYRGTLSKEQIGRLDDGIFYYKTASVDIVQR